MEKAQPKSLPAFLTEMLDQLALGVGKKLDDGDKASWGRELKDMVAEHGQQKVRLGVSTAIRNLHDGYPPKPGDVWEAVRGAHVEVARRYCDMCEKYEGWIHILVDGEKVSRVMRCQHDGRIHVRVQVGPSGNRMWMDAQVYNGPVSPEPKKYEPPQHVGPQAKPVIPSTAELAKEMQDRLEKRRKA